MVDRPIIFSAPMIKALLAGRKTQTRRVLSPQNTTVLGSNWSRNKAWNWLRLDEAEPRGVAAISAPWCHEEDDPLPSEECGYYRIRPIWEAGDRLWVREAYTNSPVQWHGGPTSLVFAADHPKGRRITAREAYGVVWNTSIHMPRWASRLTLTVSDVRVQRLQEISEEDAVAEGMILHIPTPEEIASHKAWCDASEGEYEFDPVADTKGLWYAPGTRRGFGMTTAQRAEMQWAPTAACAFRFTWESLHGPDAWSANPWVIALTFTVGQRNIDAPSAESPPPSPTPNVLDAENVDV